MNLDVVKKPRTRKRYTDTHSFLVMLRRMIRTAGRRVGHEDPEALAELIAMKDLLDEAIVVAVAGLRHDGITWESIGKATGTTRQAAIMKWSHRV